MSKAEDKTIGVRVGVKSGIKANVLYNGVCKRY